ncbi:tyrosine-type recombinase/integrase [Thermoflexus sp.]|uniref:tyrosine-type recombinase/integrase n=1 Tax=Thermoflexus sp. TaxID=1969742 RepID=UPI003A102FD4
MASGVWLIVKKYTHRAWLGDVHPHALHHTFATRFLREAEADLTGVVELLRHESLNTTACDTRPSEQDVEAEEWNGRDNSTVRAEKLASRLRND